MTVDGGEEKYEFKNNGLFVRKVSKGCCCVLESQHLMTSYMMIKGCAVSVKLSVEDAFYV